MTDNAVPADLSLVPVLGIFEEAGWTANDITRPDGIMKCGSCSKESPAGAARIEALHRIEGASDPEDMQTVLGLRCPECEARGVLVAAHGPAASEQDDEFLAAITLDADDIIDPVAARTDHEPTRDEQPGE